VSRTIQVEDLLSFQLVTDLQLSPAGELAVFVVARLNGEENRTETALYLAGPGRPAQRFTGGPTDSSPRISPDGTRVAFLSRRSGQSQIWLISLDGGEAWQLTRVQGGVREFAWAPDSRRIAFTAILDGRGIRPETKDEQEEDPLRRHTQKVRIVTELFWKMDGEGYYTEARPCLCAIDAADGAQPVQLTAPPYRIWQVAWSPDGEHLLFTSRLGEDYDRSADRTRLYVMPAAGGEPRALTPEHLSAASGSFSPDGTAVAFLLHDPAKLHYDNTAIWTVPVAGGEIRQAAPHWDRPFMAAGLADMAPSLVQTAPVWSPDGSALFSLTSSGGTGGVVRIDLASGQVTPVVEGARFVYSFRLDRECRRIAFAASAPLSPGELFWRDLTGGAEERLTGVNDQLLAELALSEPERFQAIADDGTPIDGWVIRPAGFEEGKRYPAVLEIHGGPMAMYADAFFFEFQLLAAQGYGVIYSNPRGSLGYGEAFCAAISQEWGNRDYRDLISLLDTALAENSWIDPDRVGVTGGSYGGFMTNWIVGHTDRFRAAVTGRSIADWRAMVGTGDMGAHWIRRPGVPFWQDDSWYTQQSPITYVENVRTPILIEHQEMDLRCPLEQAYIWYTALKYLGKAPVKLVLYPEEFHGMSRTGKPWNRIHRLKEVLAWFDTYLKEEKAPTAP
jgi:dipeptidyl aminopeptidase/acylaminoacyl peptidase